MALIKLTAFIDQVSGKLNGTVFSRNKGGQYVRSKFIPTNGQTARQMGVRAAFAAISALWKTLTDGQRSGWDASAINFPYQNRLGDTKTLSGFALHQQLNRNLALIDEAPLVSAPPSLTTPPVSVLSVTKLASLSGIVPSDISLKAEYATDELAGMVALIYATPMLSAGVSNFKNKLKLLGNVANSQLSDGRNITALYEAVFSAIEPGARVGFKVVTININTGQASAPNFTSAIVT